MATSYVDSYEVDSATKLFSKYERLGVYEWKNILQAAKQDAQKEMAAIVFSRTELFINILHYDTIKEIIMSQERKNVSVISPFSINQKSYIKIYSLGIPDASKYSTIN